MLKKVIGITMMIAGAGMAIYGIYQNHKIQNLIDSVIETNTHCLGLTNSLLKMKGIETEEDEA